MPKTVMLIVNPFSGRGISKNTLGTIMTIFCNEGYVVTIYSTHLDTPENLTKQYSENYDLVVCVGGDGTLSGIASGLMQTENPPPFGFIPVGTANDVASSLSLSKDPKTAVMTVINGQPVPLDIGCFNDTYFTYIAAFGAFTGVSYSTSQSAKRALGHFAYVIDGLASMPLIKPHHTIIEYDGGRIEDDFIFGGVTNSTTIAGFVKFDPKDVDLGDGLFEVVLVKNSVNAVELGQTLTSILNHSYQSEKVLLLHTKNITFRFDEDVVWTKDGENGGVHRELTISNRRHALRILI